MARRARDRGGEAQSLSFLGELARAEYDFARGEQLNLESTKIYRELEFPTQLATCLQNAGFAALRQGAWSRALHHFRESLAVLDGHDLRMLKQVSVAGLAVWLALTGSAGQAVRLFAGVDTRLKATGFSLNMVDQRDHDLGLDRARVALSGAEFQQAWDEGRAMSFEAALDLALQAVAGDPGPVTGADLYAPTPGERAPVASQP